MRIDVVSSPRNRPLVHTVAVEVAPGRGRLTGIPVGRSESYGRKLESIYLERADIVSQAPDELIAVLPWLRLCRSLGEEF